MAKAIHSMIRVIDLDRSIAFYRLALGLEVADRFDFDDFVLVYLRNEESEFELELTLNKDTTEPYDHGTAYGHFAVSVDDAHAEHARFVAAGLMPDDVKELHPRQLAAGTVLLRHRPRRLSSRGTRSRRAIPVAQTTPVSALC